MSKNKMLRRSLAIALRTFEHIQAMNLAAYPRTYELLYTYHEGQNEELTAAVDALLAANGTLTPKEIQALCEKHLQPAPDETSQNVSEQLTRWLLTMVNRVREGDSNLDSYSSTLDKASGALREIDDVAVAKIVGTLMDATKTMKEQNQELRVSLVDAQQKVEAMRQAMESVRHEVITDQLTGLYNRRYFDNVLVENIRQSFLQGHDMSLLICDVDHFKMFNDTWGHQTGDQVLRLVSNIIRKSIKGRDVAARYGGEEFVVILPSTPMNGAAILAEGIRNEVASRRLVKKSTGKRLGHVTLSFGVAGLRSNDRAEDLIERADRALYRAKEKGRNCVEIADERRRPSAYAAA